MWRFLRIVCLSLALAGCAGLPTGVTTPGPTALPTHGPNPLNNTHWNLVFLNVQSNAYISVLFATNPIDYRLIKDGSHIQLEILNSNGKPVLVYDAASSSETETPTVWPQGVPPPDL